MNLKENKKVQKEKFNIFFERIIIVTRKTRLEELLDRYTTKMQVSFFLKTRNQTIDDYQLEYDNYYNSLEIVKNALPKDIKVQMIDREFLPNFMFTEKDLVIVLGQDGLVVNSAKYLDNQPILAVNPDPDRFDGVLLPFLPEEVKFYINDILRNRVDFYNITMGKIETNDRQTLYAFNDFFIGPKSHISVKYTIYYKNQSERQISSGIIASTPAGSTGWLSSVYNMSQKISHYYLQKSDISKIQERLSWEEEKMIFVVREPFISKWSSANIVIGEINHKNQLIIESHMPENGIIFSDGIEKDYISFNSGCIATIKIAEKKTRLIIKPKSSK